MSHQILAYYHLVPIADPKEEVKLHKSFCHQYDLKGRLYISSDGINGQMSGSLEASSAYRAWMEGRSLFQGVRFKIHSHHEHVFPRMTIKWKRKLVAIEREIDLSKRAPHLSPQEWKGLYEEGEALVLDVRNDYEWEIGRFKGAEKPACETFRDFEKLAAELEERVDKEKTPILMYCTGGIRCELFSPLLLEKGFKRVYQLDGGVIGWGLEEGSKHFEGRLFVFDDRLQISLSEEPTELVAPCHSCSSLAENYYNCANMECNKLFISCLSCLEAKRGCCQTSCEGASHMRPFQLLSPHKPFKRWSHYERAERDLSASRAP